MAICALILGESGTGKTFSIHNLDPKEVKILSVFKPILPFRGQYDIVKTPTGESIIRELKKTDKKIIVIDDFQYVLGIPMMRRIGENGWDKYNDIQQPYADVLEALSSLPNDVIVYLTSHVMYNDDTNKVQIKTIGKALDKYLTVEGLFMIVLGTQVVDGKYYFMTQNNGSNTLKSPEGMFPSLAIPNDLRYVTDKIRNYYYMEGAKSDEEIASEDAANAIPEEALKPKKKRRSLKEDREEAAAKAREALVNNDVSDDDSGVPFEQATEIKPEELPKRKRRAKAEVVEVDKGTGAIVGATPEEQKAEESPESPESSKSSETPKRRRRRKADAD